MNSGPYFRYLQLVRKIIKLLLEEENENSIALERSLIELEAVLRSITFRGDTHEISLLHEELYLVQETSEG